MSASMAELLAAQHRMDTGMIPQEAVEAAAKAIFDIRDDAYDMDEWEDLDSTDREPFECQARAALEAAVPFLRAQALEDAADGAEDPSPEDMDNYFIDQSDTGNWLRARAAKERGQQ